MWVSSTVIHVTIVLVMIGEYVFQICKIISAPVTMVSQELTVVSMHATIARPLRVCISTPYLPSPYSDSVAHYSGR